MGRGEGKGDDGRDDDDDDDDDGSGKRGAVGIFGRRALYTNCTATFRTTSRFLR